MKRRLTILITSAFIVSFLALPVKAQVERFLRFDQTDWSGGVGAGTLNQYLQANNLETAAGSLQLASPANWYAVDGGRSWAYRKRITFDNSGLAEDLVNFPVVLRLSEIRAALPNATDLRFVSEDGRTELPYEIETWNATTHQGVFWVKIPRLPAAPAVPEPIYVYYGNSGASSGERREDVWSEGYNSVSHFNHPFRDSVKSSSYNDAQVRVRGGLGAESVMDAAIGKGVNLSNENQAIYFNDLSASGDRSLDYTGGPLTLSAVVMDAPDGNGGQFFSKPVNGNGIYDYRLLIQADGSVGVNFQGATPQAQFFRTTARLSPRVYHFVALVVDADRMMKFFIDGVEQPERATLAVTDWNFTPDYNLPLCVGTLYPYAESVDMRTHAPEFSFRGVLDEMSIARTARSPSWIRAEARQFLNQDPTRPLSRIGGEETAYFVEGSLTSNAFCAPEGAHWNEAVLHTSEPTRGASLKIRTGATASMSSAVDFSECDPLSEEGSLRDESGRPMNDCVLQGDPCIQYQISLRQDGENPIVQRVSIAYSLPTQPPAPVPESSGRLRPLVENAGVTFSESGGETRVAQSQTEAETRDAFQVALNHSPRAVVTVVLSSDSPVVRVSPSSISFTPDNWNVPQSLQVEATQAIRLDASTRASIHHTLVSDDPDFASKNFDLNLNVIARPPISVSTPNTPAGDTPQNLPTAPTIPVAPIVPVDPIPDTETSTGCSLIHP